MIYNAHKHATGWNCVVFTKPHVTLRIIHVLYKCSAYEIPRLNLYNLIEKNFPNFRKMSDEDKLKYIKYTYT